MHCIEQVVRCENLAYPTKMTNGQSTEKEIIFETINCWAFKFQ